MPRTSHRPLRRCPLLPAVALLAAALLANGCTGTATDQQPPPPTPVATYDELAAGWAAGEQVDLVAMRQAFLDLPDVLERLQQLQDLEASARSMMDTEPLRLGAIGTAILDLYRGSPVGHLAMARYSTRVQQQAAADEHQAKLQRILEAIRATGAGNRQAPWSVLSASEAELLLELADLQPVGSIYISNRTTNLGLMIAARPLASGAPLEELFFDLDPAFTALSRAMQHRNPNFNYSPSMLLGYLASRGDPAAQAAVGTLLASSGQERADEAMGWLDAASARGNMLATLMLAELHLGQARRAGEPQAGGGVHMEAAVDNFMGAVAAGSDQAMAQLGLIYLNGYFGEENIASGVALVHQAGELGNVLAQLQLARMYFTGEHVATDPLTADRWLAAAAAQGDPQARISLVRLRLADDTPPVDDQAVAWLRETAEAGAYEAMVVYGNLLVRGEHVGQDYQQATAWYRKVAQNSQNPDLVNQVAWTLVATEHNGLRDPATALSAMERVMLDGTAARSNPAYLDTWAAAHAATGDFERALELQQEAVAEAESQQLTEVLDILRQHLAQFAAGETVSEDVP